MTPSFMVLDLYSPNMYPLVLASGSLYRRQLLAKFGLPFEWQAPLIDEQPHADETPEALVKRLAQEKAAALKTAFPQHLIIGSDQVAVHEGKILGKPGDIKQARQQLAAASGKTVTFFTGLCLCNSASGRLQTIHETYRVTFRSISSHQIETYLNRDQPFDCAGSFKAEGLGISLFSALEGRDPNTLIGLPLIALVELLNNEGVDILS
jgi:septum formation protein